MSSLRLPLTTAVRAAPRTRSPRTIGAALLLPALLVAVAIAAPLLTPYPPNEQLGLLTLRSQAPSLAHPFGTDSYSRDVLSRVLAGARVSLILALSSVLIGLTVGTAYGALTAFAPPRWSAWLRRLLDVGLSMPRLLLLMAIAALSGPLSVPALALLIGLTGWFMTGRQVADELDLLRTQPFALAAQAAGVRTGRLVVRHLLPHLVPLLVVNGTFAVASTIGLETGLSFVGIGVQPPAASWGTILRDGAGAVETEWWLTLFPGLATVLAVLACNVAGNVLRDHFAPGHVADL